MLAQSNGSSVALLEIGRYKSSKIGYLEDELVCLKCDNPGLAKSPNPRFICEGHGCNVFFHVLGDPGTPKS